MIASSFVIFNVAKSKYLSAIFLGVPVWNENFHQALRYRTEEAANQSRTWVTSSVDENLRVWPVCGLCGQPGECKPVITADKGDSK